MFFKKNCFQSVWWNNYCVHFVFQHAYITLNLFTHLQFCSVSVSISEGVLNFISQSVVNTKIRLKISKTQQEFQNLTTLVIFSTHSTTLSIPMFNMYRRTVTNVRLHI